MAREFEYVWSCSAVFCIATVTIIRFEARSGITVYYDKDAASCDAFEVLGLVTTLRTRSCDPLRLQVYKVNDTSLLNASSVSCSFLNTVHCRRLSFLVYQNQSRVTPVSVHMNVTSALFFHTTIFTTGFFPTTATASKTMRILDHW